MRHICFSILFIAVFACNRNRTKVISGLEGKPLPSFNMLLTDSLTCLNSNNIPIGQPLVLFYFSPFCPYCRAQTKSLKDEINTFKDIHFYFITPFPLYQIRDFDQRYGLSKHNNITIAQVKDSTFSNYYMIHIVPYIAIYDKQKQLKEVLLGKSDVGLIKDIALGK